MQHLTTRLDPIEEDVLKVVETFGPFRAMDQFNVRSYDRFRIWLEQKTGDKNFGLRPKISLTTDQTLGDQLVSAFLLKISALEAENEELQKQVRMLKWQRDQDKTKELNQAIAVLDVCRLEV